jgi:rubrerythrin
MNKQLFNRVANIAKDQEPTRVELGLLQDILSDVSANGRGIDKARQKIRNAFKEIQESVEIYSRIQKRGENIKQNTKQFQSQMNDLGIDKNSLDTTGKFAYDGTYAKMAEDFAQNLKALQSAASAIKQTGEV